jgi:RNA polymerase sporulation-specific sigma factor
MKRSETTATEEILNRMGGRVARLARRLARFLPGVDAEDLTQEGLIAVWRAVRSFDPSGPASFWTYARVAARRRMARAAAAESRRPDRAVGTTGEVGHDMDARPDPRTADPAAAVELRDSLAALGPRRREIVIRTFGLDGAEPARQDALAEELDLTRQSVARELSLALRELRRPRG